MAYCSRGDWDTLCEAYMDTRTATGRLIIAIAAMEKARTEVADTQRRFRELFAAQQPAFDEALGSLAESAPMAAPSTGPRAMRVGE